jgi:iron complex transport system ATP-binding protein
MAEPRLSVEDLFVWRGDTLVVQGVSFTAPAGSITVLLGPNGAGKSTILKAAAGLLPYEGRLRLHGVDVSTLDHRTRARAMAYVPQHSALEAPLPVRDVVAQGRFAHLTGLFGGPGVDDEAVLNAMERTDILDLADYPFNALSYGERRRVLLARALATGADVLLLDEPTAALDVGHALALLETLRALAHSGTALVLVLHQLQEAAAIADHAVLVSAGRRFHAGPAAEVIAPGPVLAVYGVKLIPDAQFACRLTEVPVEDPEEPEEEDDGL